MPSLSLQLYQKGTPLHSVAKYFPKTPLETRQLMWCIFLYMGTGTYVVYICIYRERYINFGGILAVYHREKNT